MNRFRAPRRGGPLRRLVVEPTRRFMAVEASGGVILVVAALIALIWENVASSSYESFWHTKITLDFAIISFDHDLGHWVNDGLMVFFFFVVGAEIKREALHGELRDPRQAVLPIAAAAGGMLVPAACYLALNSSGDGVNGWGIPVATDIAFALGVLGLLGQRVPVQLKIFLLTLAVADDVGGILIIAIAYTDDIRIEWIGAAVAATAFVWLLPKLGFRHILIHTFGGIMLWVTLHESGIHTTIAGVVLGLLVPASSLYDEAHMPRRIDYFLQRLRHALADKDRATGEHDAQEALRSIEHVAYEGRAPIERVEESMAPISAFFVVPIFALANAGIPITGDALADAFTTNIGGGVLLGLLLGKLVGIVGASALAVRLGALKPPELRWPHIVGAALLAGIGFTVAIFIAELSFEGVSATTAPLAFEVRTEPVEQAKMGILIATIIAGALGYAVLWLAGRSGEPGRRDDLPADAVRATAPRLPEAEADMIEADGNADRNP